jgi:hypothetical protein
MHLIDHLETGVNWNRFFGIVDSLYSDSGFSTNGDNFIRNTALEKALAACSDLTRVDRKGYDFLYGETKVELKVAQNMFYKRNPTETKDFKVKSFLSQTRTVDDFREESTFDYLLVIDLRARRVVIVEDEIARGLYRDGADGAIMSLKMGNYYECDIEFVNPITSSILLSAEIGAAMDRYIRSF